MQAAVMVADASLKTIWPTALGVVPCLALRLFITRPFLMSSSPRPGDSSSLAPRRHTCGSALAWSGSFTKPPPFPTRQPPLISISIPTPSAVGADAGPKASSLSRTTLAGAVSRSFPPLDRAIITSIACDVVARTGNPLSRQSTTDLAQRAREELDKPLAAARSGESSTRTPSSPGNTSTGSSPAPATSSRRPPLSWICTRVTGKGNDSIRSTGSSARTRRPASRPASAGTRPWGRPRAGVGESKRNTAAAGRCNTWRPGTSRRVWSWAGARPRRASGRSDDWSSRSWGGRLTVRRGARFGGGGEVCAPGGQPRRRAEEGGGATSNGILVHLPVHASWLNQVEVYFSLLQRKVLTANDSADLRELELRIRLYEELTNSQPRPFDWRFTKYDLFMLLQRLAKREAAAKAVTPGTR